MGSLNKHLMTSFEGSIILIDSNAIVLYVCSLILKSVPVFVAGVSVYMNALFTFHDLKHCKLLIDKNHTTVLQGMF